MQVELGGLIPRNVPRLPRSVERGFAAGTSRLWREARLLRSATFAARPSTPHTMNPTELLDKVITRAVDFGFDYGSKLLGATIILVIAMLVIRWISKGLLRWLDKRELEPPVKVLIVRVVRLVLWGLALTIVLEKVGVAIAPLIAGVGVAGVGIGLAMQGAHQPHGRSAHHFHQALPRGGIHRAARRARAGQVH
jgi:hypothetical protein